MNLHWVGKGDTDKLNRCADINVAIQWNETAKDQDRMFWQNATLNVSWDSSPKLHALSLIRPERRAVSIGSVEEALNAKH